MNKVRRADFMKGCIHNARLNGKQPNPHHRVMTPGHTPITATRRKNKPPPKAKSIYLTNVIEPQGAHLVSIDQPHPPFQADSPNRPSGLSGLILLLVLEKIINTSTAAVHANGFSGEWVRRISLLLKLLLLRWRLRERVVRRRLNLGTTTFYSYSFYRSSSPKALHTVSLTNPV